MPTVTVLAAIPVMGLAVIPIVTINSQHCTIYIYYPATYSLHSAHLHRCSRAGMRCTLYWPMELSCCSVISHPSSSHMSSKDFSTDANANVDSLLDDFSLLQELRIVHRGQSHRWSHTGGPTFIRYMRYTHKCMIYIHHVVNFVPTLCVWHRFDARVELGTSRSAAW